MESSTFPNGPGEVEHHINFLELKAAFIALKCFEHLIQGKHVRLLLDNSTAVACINKMGTSHSVDCNFYHHNYDLWSPSVFRYSCCFSS